MSGSSPMFMRPISCSRSFSAGPAPIVLGVDSFRDCISIAVAPNNGYAFKVCLSYLWDCYFSNSMPQIDSPSILIGRSLIGRISVEPLPGRQLDLARNKLGPNPGTDKILDPGFN